MCFNFNRIKKNAVALLYQKDRVSIVSERCTIIKIPSASLTWVTLSTNVTHLPKQKVNLPKKQNKWTYHARQVEINGKPNV